jgi:hypothetical protein
LLVVPHASTTRSEPETTPSGFVARESKMFRPEMERSGLRGSLRNRSVSKVGAAPNLARGRIVQRDSGEKGRCCLIIGDRGVGPY